MAMGRGGAIRGWWEIVRQGSLVLLRGQPSGGQPQTRNPEAPSLGPRAVSCLLSHWLGPGTSGELAWDELEVILGASELSFSLSEPLLGLQPVPGGLARGGSERSLQAPERPLASQTSFSPVRQEWSCPSYWGWGGVGASTAWCTRDPGPPSPLFLSRPPLPLPFQRKNRSEFS